MRFDDRQLVEMLRRSYFAADGLWFVMAEEMLGFDAALELDERVWQVMPKLQARKARELLAVQGSSLEDLARCYSLKLDAEGHSFEVTQTTPHELEIAITDCPWLRLLERSNRTHLAESIARTICVAEGRGWAAEFSERITFELAGTMCAGDEACRFLFRRTP